MHSSTPTADEIAERLAQLFESPERRFTFDRFRKNVVNTFLEHPVLGTEGSPVHSVRSRLKHSSHLRDKIKRKLCEQTIDAKNIFEKITDFAGVRILHLHRDQFEPIHDLVMAQVAAGEWVLHEPPKAYTWDPEAKKYFESSRFSLDVQQKESLYTSVHYVVKPRPDTETTCEIQVRTLIEEVWGEVDHTINYPHPTSDIASKEQIMVLARLVATGGRLIESIFKCHSLQAASRNPSPDSP